MDIVEPHLPIGPGDWVATVDTDDFRVGKVRHAYWDDDAKEVVLMDVVLYRPSGEKTGRESIALGGPKTFEPALRFTDFWRRIEEPRFPLDEYEVRTPVLDDDGNPKKDSTDDQRFWFTVEYNYHPAVKTRPLRQYRRPPTPRARPVRVAPQTDFDPALEINSLRRASQEMFDLAKTMTDAFSAAALRNRARELTDEANKLAGQPTR